MNIPEELYYTKTHEWARQEGTKVIVGITDHAQSELSDVVFIELPKPEKRVRQADPAAVIESVKAAYDIYSPVSGKVTQVNRDVEKDPALVNKDPYGKGWLFVLQEVDDTELKTLMNATQYEAFLKR